MPAGHYDQEHFITDRFPQTPDNADQSTISLLKSVKAQEVQFRRLTQELEAERQHLSKNSDRYRGDTSSMNSLNTADESLPWRSPQYLSDSRLADESLGSSKMNSRLLDSCMRELEDRGTFGNDNMDYIHDGPYSGEGQGMYGSDPYNQTYSPQVPNGGHPQYFQDERSPHGSHMSLQSGGSYRNPSRIQDKPVPGSMSSLHRQEQPHDNYASYSSLSRPQYADEGSPQGPTTPTRFNSYQQQPYGSTGQSYDDNSPRYSMASNDSRPYVDPYSIYDPRDGQPQGRGSYDRSPSEHGVPPYGSNQHIDNDPRYNSDRYGDPHNDSRVSDSFYRDSPDRNDSYRRNGPHNDNYEDFPPQDNRNQDPSYVDDRYGGHPSRSIPENYRQSPIHPEQNYDANSPPEHRFQDMSLNDPHNNYPPQEDSYDGQYPSERYQGNPQRAPDDRYGDEQPTFGDYDDQPYRKHEGLPQVQSDPFADDPFQHQRNRPPTSHDQYDSNPDLRYIPQDEYDPYEGQPEYHPDMTQDQHGDFDPSTLSSGYNEHPPQYDDRYSNDGRGTPQQRMYDDGRGTPQRGLYDDGPPPQDMYNDGRGTPQRGMYEGNMPQQGMYDDGRGTPNRGMYDDGRGTPNRGMYDDGRGTPNRGMYDDGRGTPQRGMYDDGRGTPNRGMYDDGRGTPQRGMYDDGRGTPQRGMYDDGRGTPQRGLYDDDVRRTEALMVNAPPHDRYSDGRRTPSLQGDGNNWRPPDLQEVIDYLSHPNDHVKANAAAYLQHLCYTDDDIKAKTRGLDGIPPLVELLRSDYPEVQRNACGALKNLSFGRGGVGLDNKKAIENAGGITELIRLLRKAQDEEVKELVTGILWNLSSCDELKPKIITEGLPDIVSRVIVPYSGWERRGLMHSYEPWTTVYRNATGIIRNLSSANKDNELRGYDTRNKLRESAKLVNCLIYTLKISKENKDRENKPVENCTCALRNLSFRIQEVTEQDFYKKRTMTLKKRQQPEKENTGCFGGGGGGGKKKGQDKKGKPDLNQNAEIHLPPGTQEFQALWQPEVVTLYLDILKESSNPVTVEAAAGAIQNLTACYWKFADDTRALVRKEKGLPALVDLLGQERDSVVCHSALALRNLAIDEKNKELIGKYAMKQIICTLPQEKQKENVPDRTICAVVALLHEVVNNSVDFAQLFIREKGIPRLKFVKFSRGKFLMKTKEHTQKLLDTLWEFKSLHQEMTANGLTEHEVKSPPSHAKPPEVGSSNTPYSTMSRGMESQGYDDNTLSPGRPMTKPYQPANGTYRGMVQGHSNPAMNVDEPYHYDDGRRQGETIQMNDIVPGYAPIDDRRERKTPVGGVPLFPGLQPQQQAQPQSVSHGGEPLYAQVNKNKRRDDMGPPSPNQIMLDPGSPQGGADSWV